MAQIDYYFITASPWCYLAGLRLEEVAARHGAQITYKPVDLMAVFERTGGVHPMDRHPNRKAYRSQELKRWSRKLDMPLVLTPTYWPVNAAPSSYAIIAAQNAGGGDVGALTHGLMRACWAQERDISQDDVIGDCLEAAGFARSLTMSGMMMGAETYARNTEEAIAAGVFGAPFYITQDDERFWGQDRLVDLDAHLGAL